jgi:hypothetical protein
MAKRGKKGKRGAGHTYSILTTLFAITPALYILTVGSNPLSGVLSGGGSWQSLVAFGSGIASNVVNNWVTVLIILAVVFVAIKVVHKIGRGARITRHLRA